jgi:hypothetical protein
LHLELESALPVAVIVNAIVAAAEQLETSVREKEQLESREGPMVIEYVLYDTGCNLLAPVCLETVWEDWLARAGRVGIAEIDEIDRCPGGAGHIQKNDNFCLVRHRAIADRGTVRSNTGVDTECDANKPLIGPKRTEKKGQRDVEKNVKMLIT